MGRRETQNAKKYSSLWTKTHHQQALVIGYRVLKVCDQCEDAAHACPFSSIPGSKVFVLVVDDLFGLVRYGHRRAKYHFENKQRLQANGADEVIVEDSFEWRQ